MIKTLFLHIIYSLYAIRSFRTLINKLITISIEKDNQIRLKTYKGRQQITKELNALKTILITKLNLQNKNDFEKAIIVRNHLYQNIKSNRSDIVNFFDILNAYKNSVETKKHHHICGGMQILYMLCLKSLNIPIRRVQMFDKTEVAYNGHASVEFCYNNKWYASDPTFNIMYKHENKYLSYIELYNLIKSGKSYDITTNNFSIIDDPRKNIDRYYIEIEELIKNLVIDQIEQLKTIVYPKKSNAQIYNKEKIIYDAKRDSEENAVYQFIYKYE